MRQNTRTMGRFFNTMGDELETLTDKIGNISQLYTAINVGNIAESATDEDYGCCRVP